MSNGLTTTITLRVTVRIAPGGPLIGIIRLRIKGTYHAVFVVTLVVII